MVLSKTRNMDRGGQDGMMHAMTLEREPREIGTQKDPATNPSANTATVTGGDGTKQADPAGDRGNDEKTGDIAAQDESHNQAESEPDRGYISIDLGPMGEMVPVGNKKLVWGGGAALLALVVLGAL